MITVRNPRARGRDSAAIGEAGLAIRAYEVRTVVSRTGYELTRDSLAAQVAQFRRRFGDWIGGGRGWTPWIHIADEVGIIVFALQQGRPDPAAGTR
jgi:NAD dependent epimerase/dehydratase family enzyme